jgi:hypothetical protein
MSGVVVRPKGPLRASPPTALRSHRGVEIRYGTTQTDERGTICEILDPAWLENRPGW